MACVLLKAGWIANRVDLQMEIGRERRFVDNLLKKPDSCQSTRRFVAVDGRKDANADWIAAVGATKGKTRQGILSALAFKRTEKVALQRRQVRQGSKQP